MPCAPSWTDNLHSAHPEFEGTGMGFTITYGKRTGEKRDGLYRKEVCTEVTHDLGTGNYFFIFISENWSTYAMFSEKKEGKKKT